MKNTLKAACVLFVVATALMACVNGKGDVTTETLGLNGFTKIDHGIKGDVILVKDDNQFVEVAAQQNIHDVLKVEVDGGTLKLRTKNGKSIGKYDELTFYVHAPFIEDVKIGGSGTVTGGNGITGARFTTKISANGQLKMTDLDVDYTEVIISGSGTAELSGHSDKSDFGVGSAGRVATFNLSSDVTNVQLKGNGSIETTTNVKLDVLISGSGGVYYKGNPQVVSKITGNGILVKVN